MTVWNDIRTLKIILVEATTENAIGSIGYLLQHGLVSQPLLGRWKIQAGIQELIRCIVQPKSCAPKL